MIFLSLFLTTGCDSLLSHFIARTFEKLGDATEAAPDTVVRPIRPEVGLSVLWVGHATVLIQIHDRVIITDPVFSNTVGMLAKRVVAPGIDPGAITRLNDILISHIHFDHFNFGSLDRLPKEAALFIPHGGIEYTPEFGFSALHPLRPWESIEESGLRITAVPVQHFGGRYGFDGGPGPEPTWTGYVIEYKGTTVFFAGDTGYNPELFKEIGRRFHVDLALLPIAPLEPRDFMKRIHTDPADALQVFQDVGAEIMIPIHHSTFVQGLEPDILTARKTLETLVKERSLQDRVKILAVGEQIILKQ